MDEARSAPVRPRKKIAWEGDNGREGGLTNKRPGSGDRQTHRQTQRQTHRQTIRLLDQFGPEGRVGENQ